MAPAVDDSRRRNPRGDRGGRGPQDAVADAQVQQGRRVHRVRAEECRRGGTIMRGFRARIMSAFARGAALFGRGALRRMRRASWGTARSTCWRSARANSARSTSSGSTGWLTASPAGRTWTTSASASSSRCLLAHRAETLALLERWNRSPNRWKRRASVVAFVRKVGESGRVHGGGAAVVRGAGRRSGGPCAEGSRLGAKGRRCVATASECWRT